MFFGKRPERAEAVGSLQLTQSRCLAPSLLLPGDVPGSPQGWQPPVRSSAEGSQHAGGLRSRVGTVPAPSAPRQRWESCVCAIRVSHACHPCLTCVSSVWHAELPSHPVCDPETCPASPQPLGSIRPGWGN